ncbi:MAG: hypothetical protein IKK66_04240 [Ruminococcus sp.]|nr:hypothetical protein [Ruminococcus sp.]
MKKNIFLAVLPLLTMTTAVACENKKNTVDYVNDDELVIYTDTTYPQISADQIDAEAAAQKAGKLSYALNGSHVELLLDNVVVKILDFYYTPSPENITVADYNFDGYEDIFIPYESPADYGTYYCYIPENNTFAENAELNEVGRIMKVTDERVLTEDRSDDLTKRFVEYQWFDAELRPVKKTETFKSAENGEIVTNIYGYDEKGNEFLAG